MANIFLARSNGQTLKAHLEGVSALAMDFLPDHLKELGRVAGLWHDLGKYRHEWQHYLRDGGARVTHSGQGAALALSLGLPELALIIRGHHGKLVGMPDIKKGLSSAGWEEAVKFAQAEIEGYVPDAIQNLELDDLTVRILYSALVDADVVDAAASESKSKSKTSHKKEVFKALSDIVSILCFDPLASKQRVNKIRQDFLKFITDKAYCTPDFYTLTAPTGIGKTRTSFTFAAIHAEHNQMAGILYVGPFKSIIRQTAETARAMFGADNVLEHHSGYMPTGGADGVNNYRHHAERWDKPVICTTGVRFWESLFSNRKADCRRLHQIQNRVIILDEAQAIPPELAVPMLEVADKLVKDWGCTILAMSATQPNFENLKIISPKELVDESYQKTNRKSLVRHQWQVCEKTMSWSDVADNVSGKTLIVCNTTGDAKDGFEVLKPKGNWLHLSSRMCIAHRNQVIDIVKNPDNNYSLVSTQIVEAGVDLDFDNVWRVWAGLDSIFQSAGRCNREGKRPTNSQLVRVFDLDGGRTYPGLADVIRITKSCLKRFEDPFGEDMERVISLYFKKYYNTIVAKNETVELIHAAQKMMDFPTIDEAFRLINDYYAESVFVRWGGSDKLLDKLIKKDYLSSSDWMQLQPFAATVPRKKSHEINAIIKHQNGIFEWCGDYDPDFGCVMG